jgi:hypothetical protein
MGESGALYPRRSHANEFCDVDLQGLHHPRRSLPRRNGRYSFSASADGMIRLDTRTGAISNCHNTPSGWACYAVPDERKALDEEIGRLQAENEKLKTQLAKQDPAAAGKTDPPNTADGQRRIEIPLPSDQDMDRVMSFLQRAWKRLVDMANQMQKDVSGDGKI